GLDRCPRRGPRHRPRPPAGRRDLGRRWPGGRRRAAGARPWQPPVAGPAADEPHARRPQRHDLQTAVLDDRFLEPREQRHRLGRI
ncbi:MAG: hypothetical protein AVDCRST_MAG59-985, partial [uncultured Thermomicrobiales bacterium]